jgi:hypothetical protein
LDNFFGGGRKKRVVKSAVKGDVETEYEPADASEDEPEDEDDFVVSDEEDERPAKKRKYVDTKNKARRPVVQRKLVSATGTTKSSRQAADQSSLPPLSSIPAMFDDMISRASDLSSVVDRLNGRKLRVATMCSGTESPLLALRMITRSLFKEMGKKLEIDHIFSCEIEPFKQAYIERNFAPPILFRDVLELADDYA